MKCHIYVHAEETIGMALRSAQVIGLNICNGQAFRNLPSFNILMNFLAFVGLTTMLTSINGQIEA